MKARLSYPWNPWDDLRVMQESSRRPLGDSARRGGGLARFRLSASKERVDPASRYVPKRLALSPRPEDVDPFRRARRSEPKMERRQRARGVRGRHGENLRDRVTPRSHRDARAQDRALVRAHARLDLDPAVASSDVAEQPRGSREVHHEEI